MFNGIKASGSNTNLEYGNRLYTTKENFNKVSNDYVKKLVQNYDATIKPFADQDPEKEINDWVNDLTKGKIDKVVGKSLHKTTTCKS